MRNEMPARNSHVKLRTGQYICAPANHRRGNQGARRSLLRKEAFSIFDMLHLRESVCITTFFWYNEEWVANTHEKIPSRICYAYQVYALHQLLELFLL